MKYFPIVLLALLSISAYAKDPVTGNYKITCGCCTIWNEPVGEKISDNRYASRYKDGPTFLKVGKTLCMENNDKDTTSRGLFMCFPYQIPKGKKVKNSAIVAFTGIESEQYNSEQGNCDIRYNQKTYVCDVEKNPAQWP